MSLGKKLFSFQGRLRRRDWWLLSLLLIIVQWVVSSLALGVTGGVMGGAWGPGMGGGWGGPWGPSMMGQGGAAFGGLMQRVLLIQVATAVLFLWPSVAVSVKRLHDRNRTGWWLLLPYALGATRGFLMFAAFSGFAGGAFGPGFGPGYGMMGGGWRGQWGMMGGHWHGMQSSWGYPLTGFGGLHLGLGLALLIVFLWLLVELGFLEGTLGPNRFGPSPKGIERTAA